MRKYSVIAWVLALIFVVNVQCNEEIKELEKFIQEEFDKEHAPSKRSSSNIKLVPEVASFTEVEPEGKPDKISVTILKEYSVKTPDGETEYVTVHDDGAGFKSSLNPPNIHEFIQQHAEQPHNIKHPDFKVQKAKDIPLPLPMPPVINTQLPQRQVVQHIVNLPQFRDVPTPPQVQTIVGNTRLQDVPIIHRPQTTTTISPAMIPGNYKRKTMDGWIPLHAGSRSQHHRDFFAKNTISKGAYYSPYKELLLQSETNVAPNVADVQVQKAIPEMAFYTHFNQTEQDANSQKDNVDPRMVIHAQNVIIRSAIDDTKDHPNVSQIRAYATTPHISAILRERFRQSRVKHPLSDRDFPQGGIALRTLAQAVRNGAFQQENEVVPSSAPEKELEIVIPHRFKLKNEGTQAASASFVEPTVAAYAPPRIRPTPGLLDYGEGVKYALKDSHQIKILETQPIGDSSFGIPITQGASLNEIALELEDKIRQLVQREVMLQSIHLQQQQQAQQAYAIPSVAPPPTNNNIQSEGGGYGAPPEVEMGPAVGYGVPGEEPGQPLESYGPPLPEGVEPIVEAELSPEPGPEPAPEYGPMDGPGEEEHQGYAEHLPGKHRKPLSLSLGFDTGLFGNPELQADIDTGDHGHSGHEWAPYLQQGHQIKEAIQEQLFDLGRNLFHSALDFSRKYNPITFLEKVKEFPPVRFEVNEAPKKGHKKKGKKKGGHHHHHHHHNKGHGWKRRNSH